MSLFMFICKFMLVNLLKYSLLECQIVWIYYRCNHDFQSVPLLPRWRGKNQATLSFAHPIPLFIFIGDLEEIKLEFLVLKIIPIFQFFRDRFHMGVIMARKIFSYYLLERPRALLLLRGMGKK